jgi:hypothetical protein
MALNLVEFYFKVTTTERTSVPPRGMDESLDVCLENFAQPLERLGYSRVRAAAFAVLVAGFPARRQNLPVSKCRGNKPRRPSKRARSGESGVTPKPVSGEFPVFSL